MWLGAVQDSGAKARSGVNVGLGLVVQGLGSRVWGFGLRAYGLRLN